VSLKEWLFGEGGLIATPDSLDLFLRRNNINKPLSQLWVPPLAVPVIIANGPSQAGIINWYDRSPTEQVSEAFLQNTVPGNATAASYTVPKGRKCMMELLQVILTRNTVAAPVGTAQIFWRLNSVPILFAELLTNIIGDHVSNSVGGTMCLLPGDLLEGLYTDNSTGGTIDYFWSMKGIEFDA
jgi:hypothetical protein